MSMHVPTTGRATLRRRLEPREPCRARAPSSVDSAAAINPGVVSARRLRAPADAPGGPVKRVSAIFGIFRV